MNFLIKTAECIIRRCRKALRSTTGAVGLASIMVGILVIGIIGAVIAATLFAVIPWSQDSAAQGNLATASKAEHASRTTAARFASYDSTDPSRHDLENGVVGIERPSQRLVVDVSSDASEFVAGTLSQTGQVWLITSQDPTPRLATSSGYTLASSNSKSASVAMVVPSGFVLPAGFAASVPQAIIHALVLNHTYFAAPQPAMPNVLGMAFSDANQVLFDAGWPWTEWNELASPVRTFRTGPSSSVCIVLSTDPAPGAPAARNSAPKLTLGSNPDGSIPANECNPVPVTDSAPPAQ